MIHLRSSISDDLDALWQELVAELQQRQQIANWGDNRDTYQSEQSWEGFLLRQITRSSEDNHDCVLLELDGPEHSSARIRADGCNRRVSPSGAIALDAGRGVGDDGWHTQRVEPHQDGSRCPPS